MWLQSWHLRKTNWDFANLWTLLQPCELIQMACAHKCQHSEVNCKEKWISLHKWWRHRERMASGVLTVRIYSVCVVLKSSMCRNISKEWKQHPSSIKTYFLLLSFCRWFNVVCSKTILFNDFSILVHIWSQWMCYMGCWRWSQGNRPDIHPHTHSHSLSHSLIVLPFFYLHHFFLLWKSKTTK